MTTPMTETTEETPMSDSDTRPGMTPSMREAARVAMATAPGRTPTMRGESCPAVSEDGRPCMFGPNHVVDYHLWAGDALGEPA